MSTMAEMALEYRMAAAKISMEIERLKAEGAPAYEIARYYAVLAQIRDTAQLLSGYYDTPRHSVNAAIGWRSPKKI